MKAVKGYTQYIEWDVLAAEQKWATEWTEAVWEAVGKYLNECVTCGQTPTVDRFFEHLAKIAPKEVSGEASN